MPESVKIPVSFFGLYTMFCSIPSVCTKEKARFVQGILGEYKTYLFGSQSDKISQAYVLYFCTLVPRIPLLL